MRLLLETGAVIRLVAPAPSAEVSALASRHGIEVLGRPFESGDVEGAVLVFAASGEVVVTDQIFPAPESDGVALYARGGTARLVSLDAWPLDSIWTAPAGASRSTP